MPSRCLLAEDDLMFVEIFVRILKRFDCEPTVVSTAAEAISAVQQRDYDLIVLDLRLKGSDGGMLLDYVRRAKPHLLRAVIGVSNYPVMARALAPDVPLIDKGNLSALPERIAMLLGQPK